MQSGPSLTQVGPNCFEVGPNSSQVAFKLSKNWFKLTPSSPKIASRLTYLTHAISFGKTMNLHVSIVPFWFKTVLFNAILVLNLSILHPSWVELARSWTKVVPNPTTLGPSRLGMKILNDFRGPKQALGPSQGARCGTKEAPRRRQGGTKEAPRMPQVTISAST